MSGDAPRSPDAQTPVVRDGAGETPAAPPAETPVDARVNAESPDMVVSPSGAVPSQPKAAAKPASSAGWIVGRSQR